MENQLVQTDTTGLHEMKVYNQLRDQLWGFLDVLRQSDQPIAISKNIIQLQNIMRRADSLWNEINSAFQQKYLKLKITGQNIYGGELLKRIEDLNNCLLYLQYLDAKALPQKLLDDRDFRTFQSKPREERIYEIQSRVGIIIEDADADWGRSAVKAGMNLPISAKEEQSNFFRYRKTFANPYKRW